VSTDAYGTAAAKSCVSFQDELTLRLSTDAYSTEA
jgi:hypothetical protein